jgi:hypothetical protein
MDRADPRVSTKLIYKLIEDLTNAAKENIKSIILYGGIIKYRKEPYPVDVNMLIVLREIDEEHFCQIYEVMNKAMWKFKVNPIIMTKTEILNSGSIFPIEYLEMKESYMVMLGEDIVDQIKVSSENLKHQIEYELNNKIIQMRKEWLMTNNDRKVMRALLIGRSVSIKLLLRYGEQLINKRLPTGIGIFDVILRMRIYDDFPDTDQLNIFFWDLHDTAAKAIQMLNQNKCYY